MSRGRRLLSRSCAHTPRPHGQPPARGGPGCVAAAARRTARRTAATPHRRGSRRSCRPHTQPGLAARPLPRFDGSVPYLPEKMMAGMQDQIPSRNSSGIGPELASFFQPIWGHMPKIIRTTEPSSENLLDKLDLAILRVLLDDSRKTLQEIGAIVGLSSTTCWSRIKKLEGAGVIRRYTVDV